MRRVHSQTTRIYKTYWVVKSCCSIWHLRYITNSPLWGSIVRDFKECDVQHIILGRWENMPESMTFICCLYQWAWYNTARLPLDSSDLSWTLTSVPGVCLSSFKALLEVTFITQLEDGLSHVVLGPHLLPNPVQSSSYWRLGGTWGYKWW